MAYDEGLAQRIRDLLTGEPGITEKRMFGGLAFLVDGHMAVAATGSEGVMIHVAEPLARELAQRQGLQPMVMRGRAMREWVYADNAVGDGVLEEMVRLGLAWARKQPPKDA